MNTRPATEQIRQTLDETQAWLDRIWALEQMAYGAATLVKDLKACPFADTLGVDGLRGKLMDVHASLVAMFSEVYQENKLTFDQLHAVEVAALLDDANRFAAEEGVTFVPGPTDL